MKQSLRTKLTVSFLVVIAVGGFVTVLVGTRLIGDEIIRRAQDNVRMDLNSARAIYEQNVERTGEVVRLTSLRFFLRDGLMTGDIESLERELQRIRQREGLDVLTVTDRNGTVVFRPGNPEIRGDSQAHDEIVAYAVSQREAVAATQLVSQEELVREGNDLVTQARIERIPTPRSRVTRESEVTSGMMIKAAAPIFDYDGELLGVLYGGKLLNRNYEIVDGIKNTLYQDGTGDAKNGGTVTIFQGDIRIATNVPGSDGKRAIGTSVSEAVYEQVFVNGIPWVARAFVVNAWYMTAYEPIRDFEESVIGMLYVGIPEAPYVAMRRKVIITFSTIAAGTIFLVSVVMYFTTSSIVGPLRKLLRGTEDIARGYLAYRVQATSDDELGQLARSFNTMTAELQKSKDDYVELTKTLEDKVRERTRQLEEARDQLVQSEKLSSLGKMAAGIAHEINNPLTSILLNSHLIAESLEGRGETDESLQLVIDETARCSTIVKGLLEFARQTPPEKKPVDVNRLMDETLLLMRSCVLASKVDIQMHLGTGLPTLMADANKLKQVFTNIILNALEAMDAGGTLVIRSRLSQDRTALEIEFQDTGCGIPDELIPKIFDPFFSTKQGKGTGLGLSVSYGIVRQHNGRIDVRSKAGEGTTMTVSLPVDGPGRCQGENKDRMRGMRT